VPYVMSVVGVEECYGVAAMHIEGEAVVNSMQIHLL
jgi:hypothetical protein